MRLNSKCLWVAGFAAVFATLVGYVFWGTWSPYVAPVMPDDVTVHSPGYLAAFWRRWWATGKFIPGDLKVFLGTPEFWQELNYAIPLGLSGLALAWFLLGRGLKPVAAFGAGLLLSFSGYWATLFSAGHLGWFRWMAYGVFAFGLVDRAVRDGGLHRWLLLGACVAWGSFYQPDLWLLFSVFTAAYFVHCCVRERRLPWKGALLALAAFFLIGAPSIRSAFVSDLAGRDKQIAEGQTVPTAKDGSAGKPDETRWIFVTNWSLPPAETAEFFLPRLNGDTSCSLTLSIGRQNGRDTRPYEGALGRPKGASSGNYRQHSLYVGFITCLLALFGLVAGLKNRLAHAGGRTVLFFAVSALVFWLFSLGRYCEPVYRIVYALPFGDYLRAPVKWHHLTEFSLVVLAGYGLNALADVLSRTGRLARIAPAIVGLVALLGAADLARIDRLYCAPVNFREAVRQNCDFTISLLWRRDFSNPQVQALVRAKKIVPLANPNPEVCVVGVLSPWKPRTSSPLPPFGLPTALGFVSILSSLAVVALGVRGTLRR